MSTRKEQFFTAIQKLAEDHDMIAFVVVAVGEYPDGIFIATTSGSKMRDDHSHYPKVVKAMEAAFEKGMEKITADSVEPPTPTGGGLLN